MRYLFCTLLISILFVSCKKDNNSNSNPQNLAPVINSFTPLSGGYDVSVTIRGKNFGQASINKTVLFNGKSSLIQSWSDTSIVVSVPERAGTGELELVLDGTTKIKGGTFIYTPAVFVGGGEVIAGFNTAKYWKDGQAVFLGNKGYCNAVLVSEKNVYAGGTVGSPLHDDDAVVWKNGAATSLPTGNLLYGSVLSLFLKGSDLYAAGTAISNNSKNIGLSWSNSNNPTVLTDPINNNVVAYSVFASGSDVWVAGGTWGASNGARLWKNGNSSPLIGADENSGANCIFVSGTDVYVAGHITLNSKQIAGYWKNGVFFPLSDGSKNAYASSIIIVGTDVYVAGFETTVGYVVKYWKNGVGVNVSSVNTYALPNAIAFFDGNVYMAGYEVLSNGKQAAVLWKNTNRIQLTDGTNNASASSIAIQ
jgi:hypothetical protein